MKSCEITIPQSGTPIVKSFPGLYREILNYVDNDIQKSLSMYGMILTDEFKNMNVSNPTLDDLLVFIDNYNTFESQNLTKEDRQLFMDMTLSTDVIENVKEKFINSFTVDGMFGINVENLRKNAMFSDAEILDLMNSEDVSNIQKLYYKLKQGNEDFTNIVSPFKVNTGNGFEKVNPDDYLTGVYNNYVGLNTPKEVMERAESIQDQILLNNPSLVTDVLASISNKQAMVAYETDDQLSDVVKKPINDTKTILENTLDPQQNFLPLLAQIEFLLSRPIEEYATEYNTISRYVNNVRKQSAKLGLDLGNISEVMGERSFNDLQGFLNSTFNFLMDVSNSVDLSMRDSLSETFDQYVTDYNNFYGISPQYTNKVVDKIDEDGIFINLESNRSEQELFEEKSIIKHSDTIYQKVNDNKSQTELYEMIFENPSLLPQEVYSTAVKESNRDIIMDDIDIYISDKARTILNPLSDVDTLKKIISYKIILGAPVDTEVEVKPNNSYLQTQWVNPENFLVDFNKELLKENSKIKDIFYFSNRGLEAQKVIGAYTIQKLQNELSESMFDKLQQYALLSGNESLMELKPQYEMIETDDVGVLRNHYANNMNQLQELSNPYQIIGTGAVVENITDSFVKIKGELYEQVQPNVYEKVYTNSRYLNYGLNKPQMSIQNVDNYLTTATADSKIKVKTTNKIENSEIEFC